MSLVFKMLEPEKHNYIPIITPCKLDLRLASPLDHNHHISPAFTYQKKQKYRKCRCTTMKDLEKWVGKCEVPVELAYLAEGRFSLTGDAR